MRAIKSVKKLPRPSIDNPRLVKRMKSTATAKKPTFRVDKILLASSATFKLSGDQKKEVSEEEEEEEAASSGGITAKTKSKSKLNKIQTKSTNTSFVKDKSTTTTNTSLNQTQSTSVSWKDSLRDFRKTSRPKIPTRLETPEISVTGPPVSSKGSRARRPAVRGLASTPARSSARLRQAKLSAGTGDAVSGASQVSAVTTPILNLSVMRDFKFQASSVVVASTKGGQGRQPPTRPVQSGPDSYMTPLARSLRTPVTAACSSHLNQSGLAASVTKKKGGERRLNNSVTEERSGPGSQSRQRGVLLPLLQEKDLAIQELERKVAFLEEEKARDKELKEKLMNENENLLLKKSILEKNVENFENQIKENEEKLFQLEMKNMEMYKVLEMEQDQVEFLQSEVARLTSNIPSQEEREDSDLDSLVQSFVEKVSVICRNENVKVNHRHENVKLRLVTRKTGLDSLENTELGEESQNLKLHSISSEISSKLLKEEETKEVESEKHKESPVKVEAHKCAEKPLKELRSDRPAIQDKKLELLKGETRVRTRSMSRQGKDHKVKK